MNSHPACHCKYRLTGDVRVVGDSKQKYDVSSRDKVLSVAILKQSHTTGGSGHLIHMQGRAKCPYHKIAP